MPVESNPSNYFIVIRYSTVDKTHCILSCSTKFFNSITVSRLELVTCENSAEGVGVRCESGRLFFLEHTTQQRLSSLLLVLSPHLPKNFNMAIIYALISREKTVLVEHAPASSELFRFCRLPSCKLFSPLALQAHVCSACIVKIPDMLVGIMQRCETHC